MAYLPLLAASLGLYLAWAVVLSDSLFHRVWSLALSSLLALATSVYCLPLSGYTVLLSTLTVLDLALCIALSPAQIVFHHTKTTEPGSKALEIFSSNSNIPHSNGASQATIVADIVAVHGLASTPKTTWESRKHSQGGCPAAPTTKHMWLRDFLPEENLNARVMAFNHNTAWQANALSKSLREYGDDLLRALRRVRQTAGVGTMAQKRHSDYVNKHLLCLGEEPAYYLYRSQLWRSYHQAMIAGEDAADEFCSNIRHQTRGFIFLGTPHKGAQLTIVGRTISLFGHWIGSSTSLLEIVEPKSIINQGLHESFMRFLNGGCRTVNTVCVFEAVKESLFGFPIMHVVERDSAVIDGSQIIGFEKKHRDVQRFVSREDEDYKDMLIWIRCWVDKLEESTLARQTEMTKEKTQEQQDCLQSLAFPEMNLRGHDIIEQASGTCAWLLKHQNYETWLRQHRGLLWVKGNPGAGKSTLLKYALQEAERRAYPKKLVVASFFFHGRGAPIQKSPLGLFRSLLHQILDQIPDLLSEFSSIFKKKCETQGQPGKKWEWHETELRNFLKGSVPGASKAYSIQIYVDALDECGEKDARDLVKYFQELASTEATLSICFSCRHYPIVALEYGLTICVEDENHQDIATYVHGELERRFSDKRKAQELEEKIVDKASGVFQWVVLVVSKVLKLHSDGKSMKVIQETLKKIPAKLDSLYQETLKNMDDDDLSQSLQLMQWICFAQRPLSLEELRFAMAVDADTPYSSLDECQASAHYTETNEEMEKRVKSLSGGLAEVKEHEGQRVAQFIHQSVKDYLIQSGLQQLDSYATNSVVGRAHFRLSRSCIRYMAMKEVLHRSNNIDQGLEREDNEDLEYGFPFLQYATTKWVSHTEMVEAEKMSQEDLLDLFQWPSHRIMQSWTQLHRKMDCYSARCPALSTTLLHVASRYGILSAVTAVINSEYEVDTDSKDSSDRTPLSWAAGGGHEAMVRLLVERDDVTADSKSKYGRTPLSWAAGKGHEAVVRLLVERDDVTADSKDGNGQTPLSWAAGEGHEAVVRLLVERDDVMADSKDGNGRTPLSWAAEERHEAVVRLLVERDDVTADLKDDNGQTPLSWAAERGHETVVRLLVERDDVTADSKNINGRTPLSWAAEEGHEAVVRLLVERDDVTADSKSEYGRTPLSWAAERGHGAVVRLLIKRDDVTADSKSINGRTPLSWAAEGGHEAVVRLLKLYTLD